MINPVKAVKKRSTALGMVKEKKRIFVWTLSVFCNTTMATDRANTSIPIILARFIATYPFKKIDAEKPSNKTDSI